MASINHSDAKLPPGTNYCKCTACGEYFGGVFAFDMHRHGLSDDRSCLAPSAVSDRQFHPSLKLNAKGYWVRQFENRASKNRADDFRCVSSRYQ